MSYKPWDSWDSEYLTFEEDDHYEGKTKRLVVVSKRHLNILGEIKWYGPWRQYTFFPEEATIWNTRCLEDVQEVIKALMDERTRDKRDAEKQAALILSPTLGVDARHAMQPRRHARQRSAQRLSHKHTHAANTEKVTDSSSSVGVIKSRESPTAMIRAATPAIRR